MKDIHKLLEENNLSHFEYDEEKSRIVYNHESATFTQVDDFRRLIALLKDNDIKHEDIGLDVILVEKDGVL